MIRAFRSLAFPSLILALLYTLSSVPAHAQNSAQIDKLLAEDGAPSDFLGSSVAVDGDTVLIGATGTDDNGYHSGSVYVFTRIDGVWAQQQKLLAPDGAAEDIFGDSVALDGDTALIGSLQDDGSAYVFTRTNGFWSLQQRLLASNGAAFGRSVALDGDTALVGAFFDNDNGTQSGSAYVFTRTAGVWTQQQKLLPSDGVMFDFFGGSVALDGNTALIGAAFDDDRFTNSGSAYLFTRTDGVWTQKQKLVPVYGGWKDGFGNSVALDGNTALIGAIPTDGDDAGYGYVYVFTRSADVWSEQQKFASPGVVADVYSDDHFGESMALDGDSALLGTHSGEVYVFIRSGNVWSEKRKLLSPEGSDLFGRLVAFDSNTALIGAVFDDDNGPNSGSAYVFDLSGDNGVDGDEDGVPDFDDNCPTDYNPLQENFDNDRNGDACDTDDDNDNILDDDDNCPLTVNPDQANFDDDGAGDVCDEDDDGDGVPDNQDLDPYDPNVGAGIETTISRSVLSSADDVEQRSGGRIAFDSSDLELVNEDGFNQSVGLRFADLAIPQGAIILEAHVLFWVDEPTNEPTSLRLQGVNDDDAGPWRSTLFDVSTRPRTNASINWSPTPWIKRGTAPVDQTQSPNLASLVQEIVDRPGWQADNALSLVIQGSGRRTAYSYDQASGQRAPMLTVRYATADGNQAPSVALGSDLEVLKSDALTLKGQVQDDGLPVPPGTTSIEWRKLSGPGTVDFDDPESATTAMTFSSTGRYELELRAFDGALIGLDRIIINVIGEIGEQVIKRRIASSNDDAEEALTSTGGAGPIDLDSSDLELASESTSQLVGLRFADLAIPPGATITRAWVQFTVDETRPYRIIDLAIHGENTADAVSFDASLGNVSSRPRTATTVSWSPPEWERIDDVGEAQRTSDLSAIVQEIVDGYGWQSGNALVLLIDGPPLKQRIAESFDGEKNSAPLLHVEYQ